MSHLIPNSDIYTQLFNRLLVAFSHIKLENVTSLLPSGWGSQASSTQGAQGCHKVLSSNCWLGEPMGTSIYVSWPRHL